MALNTPEGAIAAIFGELQLLVGLDEALVVGPGPCPEARELPPSPAAVREHVRFDNSGRYRPLSGLRNLPWDWHVRCHTLDEFAAVVDAVYPLAQRHAASHAAGDLTLTSLDELFARQQGRYAGASTLTSAGRAVAKRALCAACVREPLWDGPAALPAEAIPCPEPCSVFLSLCREVALWELDPPATAEPDPEVAFASFEEPGNPLREACLRALRRTPPMPSNIEARRG